MGMVGSQQHLLALLYNRVGLTIMEGCPVLASRYRYGDADGYTSRRKRDRNYEHPQGSQTA
jgi:hypothetical protein